MKTIVRAGQATDNNTAHAHCMPDTYGYKHTLGICNTCYFYAPTVVVTLYLLCLCR